MIRETLLAALLAVAAVPVAASTQLRQLVEQELPLWGYDDVDVSRLTTAQLAQLHHIMHSERTHSDKLRLIRSILRGSFYLPRRPSLL